MSEIEIIRSVKMKQSIEKTLVGDVIQFTLKTGEIVQAMKMTEGGIWCFDDCLKKRSSMNNIESFLNDVLEQIPDELKEMMGSFSDGRKLRLPTEKEVFGKNIYGEEEPDNVQQWEPMKQRRNRIALRGINGDLEWWWTETACRRDVVSSTYFAAVHYSGLATCTTASDTCVGVRPAFRLGHKEKG